MDPDQQPTSDAGGNTEPLGPDDGWTVVDPAGIGSGGGNGGGDSGAGRRRGRKPGSTNRSKADDPGSVGSFDLREILVSFHSLLAMRLNTPVLAITKEEAAKLQRAVKLVEKHHRVAMSQRHMDYMMAGYLVFEVYGPMAANVYMAKKQPVPETEEATSNPTILPFLNPRQG